MLNFETIFVMLSLIHTIVATDYCKLCKKGSHTLCRYKEGPSDICKEYKKLEFSLSVKKYIVDIHNDIRNHIASGQEMRGALGRQPAASNMNTLQWDSELAEIAQRWADQCIGLHHEVQHDQCRKTDRFEVGQNVLTAVTPSLDVPELAILILNWYKQVDNVLPSDIETFSGIQRGKFLIGQYTQLVWSETRFVGCGMSTFRNRNKTDGMANYLHRLVCNYGPRGNLIGSSVYSRGVPCSKCIYGKCDHIRTSLCQGLAEPYPTLRKYGKGKRPLEENSTLHVDMPISLFHTLSLGYILKHNLTDVINNILKKVKVHLSSDDGNEGNIFSCNSDKNVDIAQILTQLALIVQRLNLTGQGKQVQAPYHNPVDNEFLRDALKSTSNILYHYNNIDNVWNNQIYELENGQIIVNDCKHDIFQCQYEADEISTEEAPTGDIVLPNNIIYRNIKGVWFHGRCRCNYVYRSNAYSVKSVLLIVISTYSVVRYILT